MALELMMPRVQIGEKLYEVQNCVQCDRTVFASGLSPSTMGYPANCGRRLLNSVELATGVCPPKPTAPRGGLSEVSRAVDAAIEAVGEKAFEFKPEREPRNFMTHSGSSFQAFDYTNIGLVGLDVEDPLSMDIDDILNNAGARGWQLICVSGGRAFFGRPKESKPSSK